MSELAVHVLRPTQLLESLPPDPYQEGKRAFTWPALIDLHGRQIRAFCKTFSNAYPCGMTNELLGWLIGKQLGVPVAESAGFIIVDEQTMPSAAPDWTKSGTFNVAFWSCAAEGKTFTKLAGIDRRQTELTQRQRVLLVRILGEVERLEDVVAFDHTVANGDRNLGNILLHGTDVAIIDHDQIIGGIAWNAGQLSATRHVDNKIAGMVAWLPDDKRTDIAGKAVALTKAWNELAQEIQIAVRAWTATVDATEADCAAIVKFIMERTKASDHIAPTCGLLI